MSRPDDRDKEFLAEISRAPRKRLSDKPEKVNKFIGKSEKSGDKASKWRGKGAGKGRKKEAEEEEAEAAQKYRDRALERRQGKNEYDQIAKEWESHEQVTVEDSKYLGGDVEHTHLVKGLDYALLNKVRTELTKQQKAEELQQMRMQRKTQQKKQTFETLLARKVWNTLVETLHPHHGTFKQRVDRMHKAISMGQKIRGAPTSFLPGRMRYEFDTAMKPGQNDIPRIVYVSKEEAPKVDFSKKVGPVLPSLVTRIRDSLARAAELRRQRKRERASASEAPYAVAQKVVPKCKARDADNDIFEGAGSLDLEEIAKAAKPTAPASAGGRRTSYFDDAGSEKYRKAPDGQLELREVEPEASRAEAAKAGGEAAFEAAERFLGPRPGWAFKLGPNGLGYYRDSAAPAPAKAAAKAAAKATPGATVDVRQPLRNPLRTPARPGPLEDDEDAYGECFPESGLGLARMHTGEGDSDEEGEEKKKLKKKGADKNPTAIEANQKPGADAKRRKMTETQEWQKINHMIKKGNHGSLEELEAHARGPRRNRAPVPREIMSTPAYF